MIVLVFVGALLAADLASVGVSGLAQSAAVMAASSTDRVMGPT